MRLLIMSTSMERGGAEEYALTIASAARERGWDVAAVYPRSPGLRTLEQDFAEHRIRCNRTLPARLRGGRRLPSVATWARDAVYAVHTMKAIHAFRPDIVHMNLPSPALPTGALAALAAFDVPVAIVFHLVAADVPRPSQPPRAILEWLRTRGQQWVAVSEDNRRLLTDFFGRPANEVRVIYNGTPAAVPIPSGIERRDIRDSVRAELGLPAGAPILLLVGRLGPQKGFADALSAAPSLVENFPELRLVIAGEGEQRGELTRMIQQLDLRGHVRLLGHRSDVARLMITADLFVFPSHYEGCSLSLLEAMAHEMPIVASNASSNPEIVTHGEHGLLFEKGDSDALGQAIQRALRHPTQMSSMAANARLRVREFSQERMTRETLELHEVLGNSKSKHEDRLREASTRISA